MQFISYIPVLTTMSTPTRFQLQCVQGEHTMPNCPSSCPFPAATWTMWVPPFLALWHLFLPCIISIKLSEHYKHININEKYKYMRFIYSLNIWLFDWLLTDCLMIFLSDGLTFLSCLMAGLSNVFLCCQATYMLCSMPDYIFCSDFFWSPNYLILCLTDNIIFWSIDDIIYCFLSSLMTQLSDIY